MPTRLRKCTYSRSGTWFTRYSTISLIQANSSMSATPGSETLRFVHSGQNNGISRLASSTMSWNFRSSSSGAGRGMISSLFGIVRDDVERVDQVALVVGRLDPVLDVD